MVLSRVSINTVRNMQVALTNTMLSQRERKNDRKAERSACFFAAIVLESKLTTYLGKTHGIRLRFTAHEAYCIP